LIGCCETLNPSSLSVFLTATMSLLGSTLDGRRDFHESSDEPLPFVDIELHQAFVSHFQQEGLASFFIHDIGAFHDLAHFERLLAKRRQDIFSIIQHD
jgi:hypothetical protein